MLDQCAFFQRFEVCFTTFEN